MKIPGLNSANTSSETVRQTPSPTTENPAQKQQPAPSSKPPADTVQLSQAANNLYHQAQQQTQAQKAGMAAGAGQQPPGSVFNTVA